MGHGHGGYGNPNRIAMIVAFATAFPYNGIIRTAEFSGREALWLVSEPGAALGTPGTTLQISRHRWNT